MRNKFIAILFAGMSAAILLVSGAVAAESLQTTTLQLNYRQAEDVVSLIEPFIHPQGAISGSGFTIIIKTSAKNLQDIKQLIAEIDVAQRELMISVAIGQQDIDTDQTTDTAAEARLEENKSQIDTIVKNYGTQREQDKPRVTQVRVIEGQWATIKTGKSVPVGHRTRNPDGTVTETIVYKSVNSGFKVLPRIQKENVSLFIQPHNNTLSREGGGKINTQQMETTISGKLGEWLLLGGTTEAQVSQSGSREYSTQRREQSENNIYIKVDIIQE